ncbi:hypothetical protein KGM_209406 [Danaus plexippus plexippus]|uniref:Uncharacterized protein n=1 Tax=Danaus plexippus plexippus TaxID=278856 RepID=A0A212FEC8_DANPL|nr:hypothetical protein KGM_209406 [Danaus plexippus plexippus]
MVKLQNTGEGPLETTAKTGVPWLLGLSRHMCKAHCIEGDRTKSESITVQMPPRSCIEMVVELSLKTNDVWPSQGSVYPSRTITRTELCFSDHEAVMLLSLPLVLHMDMPILETEPEVIDFGFVSDNTSRKSYFTVKHSSPSAVIELATSWSGDRQFDLWPSSLSLPPGVSERVYLQFTANWMEGAVSCGEAVIRSRGAGGEWCRTTVRARACVARTTSHVHDDHTDDVNLLPS